MPSIKQADLDTMQVRLEEAEEVAGSAQVKVSRQAAQIDQFNNILDTILSAANGLPIGRRDDRNANTWGMSPGYPTMGFSDSCGHARVPSDLERHEAQVGSLQDRVVNLERRLAAVIAAAQFAKEHKA